MSAPDPWALARWLVAQLHERFDFDDMDVIMDWGDQAVYVTVFEPGSDREWIDVSITDVDRLHRKRAEMAARGDG